MDVILLDELSEKIDSIGTLVENTSVSSLIGSTSDTGGTTTAGSVMGKLNSLLAMNTNHGSQEFASSGTWTAPEGVYQVYVVACGGSGGGGGGGTTSYVNQYVYDYGEVTRYAGTGGSGSVSEVISALINISPQTAYSITIGAAGTAGKAGAAGGAGGATKFGNILTVNGGYGGYNGKSATLGNGYDAQNGSGGYGGQASSSVSGKYITIFLKPSVSGNDGQSGTSNATGGASVSNGISSSGKGGTMAAAGTAGGKGYVKIIW